MTEDNILERDRKHQQVLRIIKLWRLLDDPFMRRCFKDNIPAVECVLRVIMEMPDLKVQSLHVDDVIPNLQGRGVRFDIHATDAKGRLYDIEVQRADEGASAKRARFNSSMLDLNSLQKGAKFEQLPESYVIFITEHDIYEADLPRYHIDRTIRELQHRSFNDEAHIIYVNGAYEGTDDIGKLMHDFRSREPNDMFYEPLKETVYRYKENPEEAVDMSEEWVEWLNKERAEGKAEGEAKGRAEGKVEGAETERMSSIRAIMRNAGYSAEKAMELLGIDKSLWKKYLAML